MLLPRLKQCKGLNMLALERMGLLWHTIRHLRPVQIVNRIWRRFVRPRPNLSPAPPRKSLTKAALSFLPRSQSLLGETEFHFLNKTEALKFPEDWNATRLEKLWLYNLHYFEGLLCPDTDQALKSKLIDQWVDENPIGFGNGWEPYPISLRVANWIKWDLKSNALSEKARNSMAHQVRYLSQHLEFHLLGNHLLENIKALAFAGLYFEGEEANSWLKNATQLLKQQQNEQVLDDGGHFEQSPSYHALMLEGFLDIAHMAQLAGSNDFDFQKNTIANMLTWLKAMTRPDDKFPLFNDCAYGISPLYDELTAYAEQLGFHDMAEVEGESTHLKSSGYISYHGQTYQLWADMGHIAASYIPGHTHNDTFSFELFAHGAPVIVNTGTSTYEANERREFERSTAAHNTVQIEAIEQNELWGAFRVARRGKLGDVSFLRNGERTVAKGEFTPFSGHARHYRTFSLDQNRILISDRLSQQSNAVARLHFHPDCHVKLDGNDIIKVGDITIIITGHDRLKLVDYNYAPMFNTYFASKCLEIAFQNAIETEIKL